MATEPPMTDHVYGATKMENDLATALILGNPMVVSDIPYAPGMIGIFQFQGIPEYYCALQKDAVLKLDKQRTITLRNDLEHILSNATHKEMELGLASFAINPQGDEVVLCYFKERGVPECKK